MPHSYTYLHIPRVAHLATPTAAGNVAGVKYRQRLSLHVASGIEKGWETVSGLLTAMRGIRRAMRGTTRAIRDMRRAVQASSRPDPLNADDTAATNPAHSDLEPAFQLIEADRLARFARTFDRYSRPQLADLGELVAEIPNAPEAIAAQFYDDDYAAARSADLAARSAALLNTAAADMAAAFAHARRRESAALILRRTARVYLRPVSPRSPALPAMA